MTECLGVWPGIDGQRWDVIRKEGASWCEAINMAMLYARRNLDCEEHVDALINDSPICAVDLFLGHAVSICIVSLKSCSTHAISGIKAAERIAQGKRVNQIEPRRRDYPDNGFSVFALKLLLSEATTSVSSLIHLSVACPTFLYFLYLSSVRVLFSPLGLSSILTQYLFFDRSPD